MQLSGIHHITAVTAQVAHNLDFYSNVLGMRLVKKSVNQDDVSAYHLFYADRLGSPGTDMTFFDWPHIGSNRRGTDSIAGTAFRVQSSAALQFWSERLSENEVKMIEFTNFAKREMLAFEDPEGQRLYLVNDEGAEFEGEIWIHPDIPNEFALQGFYSVILSTPAIDELSSIFTGVLNFNEVKRTIWIDGKTNAFIFQTKTDTGAGSEVWLLDQPGWPRAHLGAGGVHHVAFRVKDDRTQEVWHSHIRESGLHVSGIIDRFWFHSIYFRVSPGILFEIATDGPGFTIDENLASLGETLVLPPFLEARREEIESALTPIG